MPFIILVIYVLMHDCQYLIAIFLTSQAIIIKVVLGWVEADAILALTELPMIGIFQFWVENHQ